MNSYMNSGYQGSRWNHFVVGGASFIQGRDKDILKQAQELFCLIELVVSSQANPRSEPEIAKTPFFLKSDSKL